MQPWSGITTHTCYTLLALLSMTLLRQWYRRICQRNIKEIKIHSYITIHSYIYKCGYFMHCGNVVAKSY